MVGHAEAVDGAHESPHSDCTCGIYAAKNIEHLRTTRYWQYGIHGEVNLWGTVVEHKLGWRAQYAYPKSFFLQPDACRSRLAEIKSRLKTLTAYGIDIFVAGDYESISSMEKRFRLQSGRARLLDQQEQRVLRPSPTGANFEEGRPLWRS